MAEPQVIRPSYRGRVTYDQSRTHSGVDHFRSRRQRPHVLRIAHAFDDLSTQPKARKPSPGFLRVKKLISGSDPAKRLIRLVSASPAAQDALTTATVVTGEPPAESTTQSDPAALDSIAEPGTISPTEPVDRALENMPQTRDSPRNSALMSGGNSSPRHSVFDNIRNDSTVSATTMRSGTSVDNVTIDSAMYENVKPTDHGQGVSIFVTLAEPVVFLSGFDNQDATRSTSMLRGSLLVRVTKAAKIKKIALKFVGKAETDWPEGIPPKRAEFKDIYDVIEHTFSFYDCNMGNSEHHGAHTHIPAKPMGEGNPADPTLIAHGFEQFRKTGIIESITSARDGRRLSLQNNHIKSLGRESGPPPSNKGYRLFTPGDYLYNFELPIDSRYPETCDVDLGRVWYKLMPLVERAGTFKSNLGGELDVKLVRAPSGDSLESVEPIAISRDWEDQLHYDIVISGKSFPLGTSVPIAFKLTPLAKVKCHRIKVFLTENVQYFTKDKKVHRMEPTRKVQLFEKKSDGPSWSQYPGSTIKVMAGGGVAYDDRERAARGVEVSTHPDNLLGKLEKNGPNDSGEHDPIIGPTELELNVALPSCHNQNDLKDKNTRIHFDTTYGNIQVNHWIKIVMRLSKVDPDNPGKRRHFEISIDSPLNILSCRSTQANTALPSYTARDTTHLPNSVATCNCPGAPQVTRRRNTSGSALNNVVNRSPRPSPSSSTADLTPPPAAHLASGPGAISPNASATSLRSVTGAPYDAARDNNRPIHLLRQPSFNPPDFDDSDPPPPLVTPPPRYETQFGSGGDESGLADYFQRLADEIDDSDDGRQWANRLEIPLTPGGRVNRSMDEVRGWSHLGAIAR